MRQQQLKQGHQREVSNRADPELSTRSQRDWHLVFGTSLHNTHRRRRAALSPLFSKSCAAGAEGLIYDKIDLLLKQLDLQIARDGYAEMRTAFVGFTTDVVYEYCLGQSFGLLEDEVKGKEWSNSIRALAKSIPYTRQFNWIIPLSQKIPISLMRIVSPDLARVAAMHHVSCMISRSLLIHSLFSYAYTFFSYTHPISSFTYTHTLFLHIYTLSFFLFLNTYIRYA